MFLRFLFLFYVFYVYMLINFKLVKDLEYCGVCFIYLLLKCLILLMLSFELLYFKC